MVDLYMFSIDPSLATHGPIDGWYRRTEMGRGGLQGRTNVRQDERTATARWADELTDDRSDASNVELTDGQTSGWTKAHTDGRTDKRIEPER